MSSLPAYTLSITDGQYPYKNAHITKIFDISVEEQMAISPAIHKFLEVYYEVKTPLLINITGMNKMDSGALQLTY